MSIEMMSHAFSYAEMGWRVFPLHTPRERGGCSCGRAECKDQGKHPRIKGWDVEATTDKAKIASWWQRWPDANIGIATGQGSNLLVVDCDGAKGRDTLARWEAEHGPIDTPRVKTGREDGGLHLYLSWPVGSGLTVGSNKEAGIDWRGEGGYVCAVPCLHRSGMLYSWVVQPEATPMMTAQPWLVDTLHSLSPKAKGKASGNVFQVGRDPEDIATHPGADDGERNQAFVRLAGARIARAMREGEPYEAVERDALDWNSRCKPPEAEAKVRAAIQSLWSKEQAKRQPVINISSAAPDDEDDEPLPLKEWPVMREEAYHGLAGEVVKTVAPHTEADPVALLVTLLTGFGNVIGKGGWFRINAERHHANLFICLVGDTSSGKGQAWKLSRYIMTKADDAWAKDCVCYGMGSGEGLVERVQDDEAAPPPALTVQPVKRLLCIEEEFVKPVTLMRREGNSLSPHLRNGWDGEVLEVLNRGQTKLKASNAHISIVAHITPRECKHAFSKGMEADNGFGNRFLWLKVRRSRLLPFGGDMSVLEPLYAPLASAITKAKGMGECRLTNEAEHQWAKVYPRLKDAWGGIVARGASQTLRLALLFALLDGKAVIDTPHLRAALAVWDYCDHSARLIFGQEPPVSALADVFLKLITAQPGITRSGLNDATGRHHDKHDRAAALAELVEAGLAHFTKEATTGRARERWYPGASPALSPAVPLPSVPDDTPRIPRLSEAVMSLPELFNAVRSAGGRFVLEEGRLCLVGCTTTPEMSRAKAEHEAMIRPLLTDGRSL